MKHLPAATGQLDSRRYRCPKTGAILNLRNRALETPDGSQRFSIESRIPNFLSHPPAENEVTRAQLQRLNQLATTKDWRTALATEYGGDSAMYHYVTNESRSRYTELLPLQPASRVLEIGPGLGQCTTIIAQRVRELDALEVVPEQAEFARLRCAQEGLANVFLACGGDDCNLPFAEASFDVVIMNLVLEWCASREPSTDRIKMHARMLNEVSRVLRAGGTFYVNTKNRFALRYLIGKPDEHCHGLRFGNALPRWLLRRLLRHRPPGLLHSHRGLRQMLTRAGFDEPESYWATPEMRTPTHLVATAVSAVRAARSQPDFPQGEMRSTRLLMRWIPAGWVKHFTPGHLFIAQKRP